MDGDCCTTTCEGGFCEPLVWCKPSFETCQDDNECCSGRCRTDALGFQICAPVGGCEPSGPTSTPKGVTNRWGELCADGCDCCSGLCDLAPGGKLRCQKDGNPKFGEPDYMCQADGELCNGDDECCSMTCDVPRQPDGFGDFPKRCLRDPMVPACLPDGDDCSDSADCCGGFCVPYSGGTCGFRCASGCVPAYDPCTQETDCCASLTCQPDGVGGAWCVPG